MADDRGSMPDGRIEGPEGWPGHAGSALDAGGVPRSPKPDRGSRRRKGQYQTFKHLLIAATLVISHVGVYAAGKFVGRFIGDLEVKKRRFEDERMLIEPVLASAPTFSKVELMMMSYDGSAYLSGNVENDSDLDHLRSKMLRLFGESRINALIRVSTADVRPDPGP